MGENNKPLEVSKNIALQEDSPWLGSPLDMEDYFKILKECIETVQNSTNVRAIVLEAWLILDYFVRMILSNLLELDKFNNEDEDFDVRNELLPNLNKCLELLEKILNIQRSLKENPEINTIKLPIKFLFFLREKHLDFFKKLVDITEKYYQQYYPDLSQQKKQEKEREALLSYSPHSLNILSKQRFCVNKQGIEGLRNLDDKWFKLAKRLNKARNKAAHSHNASDISLAFGFSGENFIEHVRKECFELINKLVGIVKIDKPHSENNKG